ncbi:MAG: hypothetical protein ACREGD_01735 [Candidatus Saccharimonadales bacterium]
MKKKLVLAVCGFVAFAAGYGAVAYAYPSGGIFGRAANRGFFTNSYDTSGWEVLNVSCSSSGEYGPYNYNNGSTWCNAIPRDLNNTTEFFNFIQGRLDNGVPNGSYGFGSGTYGDTRARTGAAFIVHTMLGTPDGQRNRPPTSAQMTEWRNLVNQYASAGLISWSTGAYSYNINSYFQGTDNSPSPNDDAFYDSNRSGLAIVFHNPSGGIAYAIRRECANPVGQGTVVKLEPLANYSITGRTTVSSTNAVPGSNITFNHYVRNNGPTSTSPTNIWWVAERTSPAPQETVGGAASSGVYASGEEKNVFNHTITIPLGAPPGTQFCERVGWDPVNSSGVRDGRGTPACATVPYSYDLTPSINAAITSGGSPITGNVAEPGDTITFTYAVNNGGSTESQSITCTYRQQTHAGYNESAPTNVFTPSGANCPPARTFPANSNTTTAIEASVPAASANTTICRSFTVSPVTQSGGTRTAQACVLVAAKPYARVWGGDISAGNGLTNSSGVCSQNNNGAIVSWNKRSAGSSAGAGVQFAAYALARITDFATALYDPGGAPSPNGLSFANTSGNAANGDFGGSFGSLPCIPDYYANRPDTTQAIPATVAAMVSGEYGGSGNITLGGGSIVNPNNRITVYVDGNVFISSNIAYAGSWSVDSIPLFELVVRGNIYIDNDVTQLDGVYVAQANSGGSGGEIHTCANGFAQLPFNTLYSTCDTKLTVNGLFTANRILLLRTIGTLAQSNTSEPSTSGNVAETFNYGPAVWIAQPVRQNQGATPDYDAIISLPPIL